ncbi:unnamed protein product [Plutella xylostella]|uniref:(diamondback moth) hypothetical protein n=1 Tax=Plutella xylostella TaxID=51655 RepID=A0A8S4EEH7_PLUXY|nr:unnamed protein product [Plutella xylostella]
MLSKISLVISNNDKEITTITKETSTAPVELVDSLQEFQKLANDALTDLIQQSGDSVEPLTIEDVEDSDSEEADAEDVQTPKKRRK